MKHWYQRGCDRNKITGTRHGPTWTMPDTNLILLTEALALVERAQELRI